MPKSRPFFLARLKNNRFFRMAVCFVLVSPLLWLVYTKRFAEVWIRANATSTSKGVREKDKAFLVDFWGNFEPPEEPEKFGPGEGGQPHKLPQYQAAHESFTLRAYGYNELCSSEISVNRSLPDLRHPECKQWQYPEKLPKATVVIVFYNEGFTTLVRTVHSVINHSPPQFLAEVLLIDDYSYREDLTYKLEYYVLRWNGKVRLSRNKRREGLINTRSRGAREARGEVVIFLDAHCEVNKNWLPPLLYPIYENSTTMTVPIIDRIDSNDFHVRSVHQTSQLFKGLFDWGLVYKEKEVTSQEMDARAHPAMPYKSPTLAGGIFAINREYFLELGAFDPGLLTWGGENFELSFKIWQCGGNILMVPCSRIAHLHKRSLPYSFPNLRVTTEGPIVTPNYKRVVETWFDDEYKQYFYTRQPMAKFYSIVDFTKQLELKEKLQCKSFQWYLENVAPDLTAQFPFPPPNVYWGEIENMGTKTCLDQYGSRVPTTLAAVPCSYGYYKHQLIRLNAEGQLGIGDMCVVSDNNQLKVDHCPPGTVSGHWQYNVTAKTIEYNEIEQKCLAIKPERRKVFLGACDPASIYQQWKFKEVRP